MTGIRLFNSSLSESMSRVGFDLVLEAAEDTLETFQEMAKNIEDLEIIEDESVEALVRDKLEGYADELDDGLQGIKMGLSSVNAMQDTSMLIAPAIHESTRQDINLVRQVAFTAAAGMGINPKELLPENMDNTVGKPMSLNMEGFKEKTVSALKAIWRFILAVFDYAVSIFKTSFSLLPVRLHKLRKMAAALKTVREKPTQPIGATENWWFLTEDGEVLTESSRMSSQALWNNVRLFQNLSKLGIATEITPDIPMDVDVKKMHEFIIATIDSALADVGTYLEKDGKDMISLMKVGGGYLRLTNGVAALAAIDLGVGYGHAFSNLTASWENKTVSGNGSGATYVPDPSVLAEEVSRVIEIYTKGLTPAAINTIMLAAKVNQRELKNKLAGIDKIITARGNEIDGAYMTELAGMYRALITIRFGAVSRFMMGATDVLTAYSSYLKAYLAAADVK